MIMRPGQPLLLPANPFFIWMSLFGALMLNMLPVGRTPHSLSPFLPLASGSALSSAHACGHTFSLLAHSRTLARGPPW